MDGALQMPPPAAFALTDASSLLWRMDILGVETGADRWRGVAEVIQLPAFQASLGSILALKYYILTASPLPASTCSCFVVVFVVAVIFYESCARENPWTTVTVCMPCQRSRLRLKTPPPPRGH